MKVVTIVGTRPEIIRLSSIIKKLDLNTDHTLVHTGQNYDYELNEIFFDELLLKSPDYFLDVSHKSSSASAIPKEKPRRKKGKTRGSGPPPPDEPGDSGDGSGSGAHGDDCVPIPREPASSSRGSRERTRNGPPLDDGDGPGHGADDGDAASEAGGQTPRHQDRRGLTQAGIPMMAII